MIKSMTGYGKAEAILPEGKLRIEIKTLNGKNADINIKTSLLPKDKDLLVRRKLADSLVRGTIDFYVTWEPAAGSQVRQINPETVADYYSQIKKIEESLGMNPGQNEGAVLSAILRFPDLTDSTKTDIISDENWDTVEKAIDSAIAAVNDYRVKEGAALYKDVTSRVGNILDLYNTVESHEGERIESVKERIRKNLESLGQQYDPARFEQELVFYVEKLDINEEKVRLRQHCKYFMDTIDNEEYPGRKLGFILQEMGREINTTGSKANHAGIQKAVVRMKDELEKIREQSMNIL
jgi:uncharacterized protein (TIGR00255 family)